MSVCARCQREIDPDLAICPACGAQTTGVTEAPTAHVVTPPTADDAPFEARFVPGDLLVKRFRISGLIARGGMGEVYRADDVRLGQAVALKFLPEAIASDPIHREILLNEVRLARRVSHPNVCRMHDLFDAGDQTFLVMEYVDGENLAALLRRIGRLPHEKAIDIARQICLALEAAHSQGVLHRDLKPENIMLDARGRVRIMDFGIASMVGRRDKGPSGGTPAYMPPEIVEGGAPTPQADLFSVGMVFYELFAGRKPWPEQRPASGPPTAPSEIVQSIDPAVERLILQCLETSPAARPASAHMVALALPGADPLAAAMAAGETPPPEIVAEAGGHKGLGRRTAGLLLATTLVGALVVLELSRWTSLTQLVPFDRPPAALAEHARQCLERLGYGGRFRYVRSGFEVHGARLRWLAERGSALNAWNRLRDTRPSVVTFWVRTANQPLVPMVGEKVTPEDPPNLVPGMISVVLDTEGRLCHLHVVPQRDRPSGQQEAVVSSPDWPALFDLAHLELAGFERVPSQHLPADYADERLAWSGHPSGWGGPVRVEAASLGGRVTAFDVLGPWPPLPAHSEPAPVAGTGTAETLKGALALLILAAALAVARRNHRLGRVDHRGALRTAMVVLVVDLASRLLDADHALTFAEEQALVLRALGGALRIAGTIWVLYLALEPHVRRYWPTTLVTWTRVLGGQWRDPLVGRDILVGAHIGVVTALLLLSLHVVPGWLGYREAVPLIPDLSASTGVRALAGAVLGGLGWAIRIGMSMAVTFVLLRLLLRREWIVILVFVVLFGLTGFADSGMPMWLNGLLRVAIFAPPMILFLRSSLIALIAAVFVHNCFALFVTSDMSSWAAGTTLTALALVASVAVLGYRTSTRVNPARVTVPTAGA